MIARWPGTIPPGTVSHRKIHCLDFYPTCLQLAGNKWSPPRDQHPLDGDPFAHVLRTPTTKEKRDPIFVAVFSFGCALAAFYAYLIQSYPFLIAEGTWAVIAFRRWRRRIGQAS